MRPEKPENYFENAGNFNWERQLKFLPLQTCHVFASMATFHFGKPQLEVISGFITHTQEKHWKYAQIRRLSCIFVYKLFSGCSPVAEIT